jgi:hypothetical protein
VIIAHHMGEGALLGALAAGGTTAATGLLLIGRAQLDSVMRWLRRK